MKPRQLLILLSIILQLNSVLSKGGGGGNSSGSRGYSGGYYSYGSNTRWVFWYYGPYGNRSCGNLCIITFAIFVLIILTIIGCFLHRCIRSRKRENRGKFQSTDDGRSYGPASEPIALNGQKHDANFPSLTADAEVKIQSTDDLESGSVLSSYGNQPPASEPIALHGQKHEAPASLYEAGEEFTRDYPPQETLTDLSEINKDDASYRFELDPQVCVTRQPPTISNDGRVIQFYGKKDAMVQANFPSLTADAEVLYYFEITVLSNQNPMDTTIAIGLATKPYPPFRLPGWNQHSVGYHSDDGRKFNDAFGGRKYGPDWGKVGDTVGCGYYPTTGFVFFTKNGQNLGNAFTGIRHSWYPTVGADGPCKLDVNFGDGKRPFVYSKHETLDLLDLLGTKL